MGTTDQETSVAARRMKAYIDGHINEPITARMLSDVAGYSQYHAERIFKQHTGRAPFEYIRERRLINAAISLRRSRAKVMEGRFSYACLYFVLFVIFGLLRY